jgi:NADH-quinone oxidoreductase subunit N
MSWLLCMPELYFLLMAGTFFTVSMTARPDPSRDHRLALAFSAAGLMVTAAVLRVEGSLFDGLLRVDFFSQAFKLLIAAGVFLVICLCAELKSIREKRHSDFYLLLSLSTLAMMVLVSSTELITTYLALELTSYSLYVLVALRKGFSVHVEGAIKYFIVGAVTSAVMLLGLALLMGATGTTHIQEIRTFFAASQTGPGPMAFAGLLLTLSGFFFKLALFPFHVWAPDVYAASSNQVTAYIATATKAAAVAVLTRYASLGAESVSLVQVLSVLAIASMTFGNLVAIVQKDMKRLLAYSAIAHAGYVLLGVLSMTENGYAGALFYALAYLAMTFICFMVVVKVASAGNDLEIAGLAGLHRRSPLLAMCLMLGVFSLGGIPPTIGFTGKFFVFTAAMEKGHFYLVLVGMVNVVVSLYYYALVVKTAYLPEPKEGGESILLSPALRVLAIVMIVFIVGGGVFPGPLYNLAREAARALGG